MLLSAGTLEWWSVETGGSVSLEGAPVWAGENPRPLGECKVYAVQGGRLEQMEGTGKPECGLSTF